jgi:hypothetical protein
MTFPFDELKEFIDHYNNVLQTVQSKAIFVRGIEQQKEQIPLVDELLAKVVELKNDSISKSNELKANFLLCLQLGCKAMKNELLLIVSLKEDNAAKAWDYLIDAQSLISLSIRNNPFKGDYLMGYAQRLHLYEILLFPKMVFASRGCIVGKTECSICNQPYGKCDHIKGNFYRGEICSEIVQEIIALEEISMVENPADKRCRTVSYNDNGKTYDVLTHREITS